MIVDIITHCRVGGGSGGNLSLVTNRHKPSQTVTNHRFINLTHSPRACLCVCCLSNGMSAPNQAQTTRECLFVKYTDGFNVLNHSAKFLAFYWKIFEVQNYHADNLESCFAIRSKLQIDVGLYMLQFVMLGKCQSSVQNR